MIALVLPWGAELSLLNGSRRAQIAAAVLVGPLLLYSLAVGFGFLFNGAVYRNGQDLSFLSTTEIPWNGTRIRAYRTDGGATTDYGIVIRQERQLLPGILLVRNLDSLYHWESVALAATQSGIRVSDPAPACRALETSGREYRLESLLYF